MTANLEALEAPSLAISYRRGIIGERSPRLSSTQRQAIHVLVDDLPEDKLLRHVWQPA